MSTTKELTILKPYRADGKMSWFVIIIKSIMFSPSTKVDPLRSENCVKFLSKSRTMIRESCVDLYLSIKKSNKEKQIVLEFRYVKISPCFWSLQPHPTLHFLALYVGLSIFQYQSTSKRIWCLPPAYPSHNLAYNLAWCPS